MIMWLSFRRLERYFAPKQNVCVERYRFRNRGQHQGETTAQWVPVPRQLASTCEYGALTDEFTLDQVIEKTLSSKIRQRLLMEGSELSLERTLTIADTLESAEREARVMEAPLRLFHFRRCSSTGSRGVGPGAPVQTRPQWARIAD